MAGRVELVITVDQVKKIMQEEIKERLEPLLDENKHLRSLVGGPRRPELKKEGEHYCKNCGVRIMRPMSGVEVTGPWLHRPINVPPYTFCRMLTVAEPEAEE